MKTGEFPFGTEGANTLVVCHNDEHRRKVAEAFGIVGHYVGWGNALCGRRYDRVIVFRPPNPSEEQERWVKEVLPLKLPPNSDALFVV